MRVDKNKKGKKESWEKLVKVGKIWQNGKSGNTESRILLHPARWLTDGGCGHFAILERAWLWGKIFPAKILILEDPGLDLLSTSTCIYTKITIATMQKSNYLKIFLPVDSQVLENQRMAEHVLQNFKTILMGRFPWWNCEEMFLGNFV